MNRQYKAWLQTGAKTIRQQAREKALDILEHHVKEPLSEDVISQLGRIMDRACP